MNFYPLTVVSTTERIGGLAKTVEFAIPDSLRDTFNWQAGQHITLKFNIEGEEVRRSYTISASPHTSNNLQITVKRVKDGIISNHINDTLVKGSTVEVMPPFGNFTLIPSQNSQRTLYFIGAGSGITPLYAMINTALASEPHSVCHLLFANKDDTSIIFKDEITALKNQANGALTVSHVLSKPRWTSSFKYWKSDKINPEMLAEFIDKHPPYAQDAQYFICGPGTMNMDIKRALMSLDVPADRIHFESFGTDSGEIDESITGMPATLHVQLNNETHTLKVAANETLLDAMRHAQIDAPFSCQSGVCGACKAKVVNGSVAMKARMALDDDEIAQGYILSCQSLCQTEQVEIAVS